MKIRQILLQTLYSCLNQYKQIKQKQYNNLLFISVVIIVGYSIFYLYQHFFTVLNYDPQHLLKKDLFGDFYNGILFCKDLNPYYCKVNSYIPILNYFPFIVFVYFIISLLNTKFAIFFVYVLSSILWYFCLLKLLDKSKRNLLLLFIVGFINHGFLGCFFAGNLEIVVAILVVFFLYFYINQKDNIAIVFLAIAASFKLFPLLFILLFIADKKYVQSFKTILLTILLIILPIFFLNDTFYNNLSIVVNGFELNTFLGNCSDFYSNSKNVSGLSLLTLIKSILIPFHIYIPNLFSWYLLLIMILTLVSAYFIILVFKTLWEKVMIISLMLIIFPHFSMGYKVLFFIPSIILYINAENHKFHSKYLNFLFPFLMAISIVTKTYYYFPIKIFNVTNPNAAFPINEQITTLIYVILMFIIFKENFSGINLSFSKQKFHQHYISLKKSSLFVLINLILIIGILIYTKEEREKYKTISFFCNKVTTAEVNNNISEEIKYLKLIFQYRPYRFHISNKIANCYEQKNQIDSALKYYKITLNIFPEAEGVKAKVDSLERISNK